ncbi:MAG: Crp/Fnr family transcriptional regulator [Acidimicrobiia bacterium]|nr:Crp/Fnr family transcriptional regulator [Acidimicrobiia bacterium]
MDWPLLRPLTEEDRRRVLAAASRHRYRRGEAIIRAGDRADSLHLLDKGHVAVQMTTPLGQILTLAVLGPGEMFGELAALTHEPHRTATILSLERTETMVISGDEFAELRRRYPTLNELLLELASARIPRLSGQLLEALFVRVDKRVLRRVLALAELYGGCQAGTVIPVRQDDVAELAGASRPTVNRALKEAEAGGAVALGRGRITVVDPACLARMCR